MWRNLWMLFSIYIKKDKHTRICLSLYLSLFLYMFLSYYLFAISMREVYIYTYIHKHLVIYFVSTSLSILFYLSLFVCLHISIYLSIYFLHLSVHLSIQTSIHPFMYLCFFILLQMSSVLLGFGSWPSQYWTFINYIDTEASGFSSLIIQSSIPECTPLIRMAVNHLCWYLKTEMW